MQKRIIYKDEFSVIGKMGQGPAGDPKSWIPPLCEEATAHFSEITNDDSITIVGTVHERYPEPENPNVLELYFPIAAGMLGGGAK
jgi:hypothetical protein